MRRTPLARGKPLRRVSERMRDIKVADGAWSEAVRWRDDHRCQARAKVPAVACAGEVVAHHIYPKEDFPHLRHEVRNGVSLCPAHHNWVHDVDPWRARSVAIGLLGPFRETV